MKKIIHNIIYNGAYQVLLILLPIITAPYISRVLGADNIGVYSYYFTFASYFFMISKLGVANYGSRSIASISDNKPILKETFYEIYGVQFLVSCAAVIIYYSLVFFQANKNIYLCAGLYVLSGLVDISWLFFGLEDFKKTAVRSAFVKVIAVILVFIFVKKEDDLITYSLICFGAYFIMNLILWFMLPWVGISPALHISKKSIKHIKPLLILFLPLIGVSLYKYMDKLMLGSMVDIKELGFYQLAEGISCVPTALIAAIGVVMLPRMSFYYSKGKDNTAVKYLSASMWLAVFVASGFAFCVISVAPEFVVFFYGPGYERCILLLRILMVSTLFLAMANVIRTQILIPKELDKIFVISIFSGAAVNLILNLCLIPKYGAAGASLATVIAEFTVFAIQTIMCIKCSSLCKSILQSVLFIFFGIIMVFVSYLVPSDMHKTTLTLFTKVILNGIVYLLLSTAYFLIVLKKDVLGKVV